MPGDARSAESIIETATESDSHQRPDPRAEATTYICTPLPPTVQTYFARPSFCGTALATLLGTGELLSCSTEVAPDDRRRTYSVSRCRRLIDGAGPAVRLRRP